MSYTCNECGKAVAQMIPGETHSTCEGHEVSRWDAFTDDELEMLRSGLSWFWDRESEGRVRKTEALMRDMDAELERRIVSDREAGGSS